jgi:hypothetical protein
MPLANGVAVKPAYEPSARRLAKFLQKASRTNSVALSTPIPRTLERSRIIRSLVSAGVSFSTTASRAASTAAICAITSSSLSTSRSKRECAAAGIFAAQPCEQRAQQHLGVDHVGRKRANQKPSRPASCVTITREIGRPDKAPFAFSFSSNAARAGPFGSTTYRVCFLDPGS